MSIPSKVTIQQLDCGNWFYSYEDEPGADSWIGPHSTYKAAEDAAKASIEALVKKLASSIFFS